MKNIKNKKALLFGGILCLAFAAIAITIAYNMDRSVLANRFKPGVYKTVTTEEFIGPDNWAPCQAVPKTVTVKNEGDIDVSVRISYEDYWKDKIGDELSSQLNGVNLVDIVFQNENDWELSGGYYYYKHTLAPGESSNSLFKEVVLNCEADFGGDSVCYTTATGTECTTPEPNPRLCILGNCVSFDYRSAKYHLKIKVETIQADRADLWHSIAYAVSQSKNLIASTEKGTTVQVFSERGAKNNIIWSDLCWKAVRTTYTGGVKMIYSGIPTTENGAQVCPQNGSGITVNGVSAFKYDNGDHSGYMYGDAISSRKIELDEDDTTTSFVFSNGVSRNGNTYTLDTSAGQYIEGAGVDLTPEAQTRYHYFCTDGSSICDNTKIGYLIGVINDNNPGYGSIFNLDPGRSLSYYSLDGFDDVDDLKSAMFTNTYASSIKTTVESWFEANNLDDDKLEDVIFCNDRNVVTGSLAGPEANLDVTGFAFENRVSQPTLDCANKNDAFTKDDTTNGNGKLSHKVGLLTADEMKIVGITSYEPLLSVVMCYSGMYSTFLGNMANTWSMTPVSSSTVVASGDEYCVMSENLVSSTKAINPVVSLKGEAVIVDGNGEADNPYIIE